MLANPLQQLTEIGQSVWLDFISRELVTTGQLDDLVENSFVTGLTSNPTIFEKAITKGTDYDPAVHDLLAEGVSDPTEIFLRLSIKDIQDAADIIRPAWDRTKGADGYVSIEVFPSLAHDTQGTIDLVNSLWERVNRPNLMVKIPATPEGIPAIEQSLAAGRNINVTLIFSLAAYAQVINAYLNALEQRNARGESLDVHSVASFFVSRVDTETDNRLDTIGTESALALRGKAAIANARLAYKLFEQTFRDNARFAPLQQAGAHVQRPLWASTSAKNPKYRDVIYAEALIGPDTVDTMPPATIKAFVDHGVVALTANQDYEAQQQVVADLAAVGVQIEEVTSKLLTNGVASFGKSYDDLITAIANKIALSPSAAQ
jgi:transaldolase